MDAMRSIAVRYVQDLYNALTFCLLMNHVMWGGGREGDVVQFASSTSPTWYSALPNVIFGS